mmetsp:Transcript_5604/g.9649  ORF Transcript_5604/g.9649 Transcript_5604/m.9649 type:complete len:115 (+) Transcript_5604:853-1197(+)
MLKQSEAIHLNPLPHKVPVKGFEKACVDLTLVQNELDMHIFSSLIKMFGFQRKFEDGKTTHLIVFGEDYERSKKLQHIKSFKRKPMVVSMDWLFDCMETAALVDGCDPKYAVET